MNEGESNNNQEVTEINSAYCRAALYSAVALGEIAGMALQDGKLALRDASKNTVTVDLPPTADPTRWS